MAALKTDFTSLVIGASSSTANSVQGLIDDFAIYDTALSGAQISQLQAGASPMHIGVDGDADGIEDAWEHLHFGNLSAANANTDADGDGQSDLVEFSAATAPNNAEDYFKITNASKATGQIDLSWTSKSIKSYRVEYSTDLQTWHLVSAGHSGTGAVMSHSDTDTTRLSAQRIFYRVVIE